MNNQASLMIKLNKDQGVLISYALEQHLRHCDRLLGDNYEWPRERKTISTLIRRLDRAIKNCTWPEENISVSNVIRIFIVVAKIGLCANFLTPAKAEEIGDPHTGGAWSSYHAPVVGGYYNYSNNPTNNLGNSGNFTTYSDSAGRNCSAYSSGSGYTSFNCN